MLGIVSATPPLLSVPAPDSLGVVADRLASLLLGEPGAIPAPAGQSELDMVEDPQVRALPAGSPPSEVWAVDGGQGVVADARCLRVILTRASRVAFRGDRCVVADEGQLRIWLLGAGAEAEAVASLGMGIPGDASVDVNLLRDAGEWQAVAECVQEAAPGALVLVDGDLRSDWRIPRAVVAELLESAAGRGVHVVGVTKHSSLSRAGVPLVGMLEAEGTAVHGDRSRWWAEVASGGSGLGYPLRVAVARLDPDARFAFRVDMGAGSDPEGVLGALATVCTDAAFAGYPYPLAVADRLAACPRWICHDAWLEVEDRLHRAGVDSGVRERAFADRHGYLERS